MQLRMRERYIQQCIYIKQHRMNMSNVASTSAEGERSPVLDGAEFPAGLR